MILKRLMPDNFNDLTTADDMSKYCKRIIPNYNPDLSKQDKEQIASAIGAIIASEQFSDIQKAYPIFIEIEALASDLEWSNSSNVDEDWQKLIAYIDKLDKQVSSRK